MQREEFALLFLIEMEAYSADLDSIDCTLRECGRIWDSTELAETNFSMCFDQPKRR
jgi:hypothetical protein